jgi:hypothetical protein
VKEMSLNQEREYWDTKIGDAMRSVQERREFANAFRDLFDRIVAVEPTSPIGGNAQRYVLNYCEEKRQEALAQAEKKQLEVDRLKDNRP